MKLSAEREAILQPLQAVIGVVERRQTMPILANVLLVAKDGKLSITDGPFAETNEQLGGFILIAATDLNDAIQVASRIPSARLGCVEVRPIVEFERPQ